MTGTGRLKLIPAIAAICGIATLSSMARAARQTTTLPAFSTVRVCVPYNVLISPAANDNQYAVVLDADALVQRTLQALVADSVLSLGVSGSFETTKPIKLTVQ
jgi:hypothetical protein